MFIVGGIIAAYSFLAADAPFYKTGYSICLAFICLSSVSCLAYFFYVSNENRRREQKGESDKILSKEEKIIVKKTIETIGIATKTMHSLKSVSSRKEKESYGCKFHYWLKI